MVGGAIIVIDEKTQQNHLDFLFVKCSAQNKGIGKSIWFELEKLYPNTNGQPAPLILTNEISTFMSTSAVFTSQSF